MYNSVETILFSKQSKMKIGNTTYVINSYFDKTGKTLNQKMVLLKTSRKTNS